MDENKEQEAQPPNPEDEDQETPEIFSVTDKDMAFIPEHLRRLPDPRLLQMRNRTLRLRETKRILHESIEKIQTIYDRGLETHEANARILIDDIVLHSANLYDAYKGLLDELSKEKQELEETYNELRRTSVERETELTNLSEVVSKLERSYSRLNIKLIVIEANCRLNALYHSTMTFLKRGTYPQLYRKNPPFVRVNALKTPSDLNELKKSVAEVVQSLKLIWVYRRHLYSDDCLDLFTRLRDCEEFEGKKSLVNELFKGIMKLEISPDKLEGSNYSVVLNRVQSEQNREQAWFIGMEHILKVLESCIEKAEFRYRVHQVNNIRKQHFVMIIQGYVPKNLFFPNVVQVKNIDEVDFNVISQHYFNYRSRGASQAWRVCDEEGELIPDEAAIAEDEIAAIEEEKRKEWETMLEQSLPLVRANLIYRKTGHFEMPRD